MTWHVKVGFFRHEFDLYQDDDGDIEVYLGRENVTGEMLEEDLDILLSKAYAQFHL
jgi:hypothetical protein